MSAFRDYLIVVLFTALLLICWTIGIYTEKKLSRDICPKIQASEGRMV